MGFEAPPLHPHGGDRIELVLTVPTSVASGAHDAGLGYAKVWAAELPQGRLVELSGGHLNLLDPRVSRRIVELLLGDD